MMPILLSRLLLPLSLTAFVTLACSRNEAKRVDAAAAPDAAAQMVAPLADAGHAAVGLTAADRATVLRELNEGRRLSRAKDWTTAIQAFDRALAIAPDDPRVLSEVGWAALQANDLDRAAKANRRALASTKDPKLRASILYNTGRVADARGDTAAASRAYAASLALRANAEVKKRLADIDAGAPSSDRVACREPVANTEALCTCLRAHREDVLFLSDGQFECKASALSLGDPRLGVVTFGHELPGETVHLLTVREGARVRLLAELGRDYEPGAFGVHNSAKVKGGEKRTVNGHDVVVVTSIQSDDDFNMAGLELCTHRAKLETVCALGTSIGSTTCSTIPVDVESGCGIGVELEPSEIDPETKKTIDEIKKNASHTHSVTTWSLANDGMLTVSVREGSRDLVEASILRPHALW